jgi:hypothetical protein
MLALLWTVLAAAAPDPPLFVRPEEFRQDSDGENWAPAFQRAIRQAAGGRILLGAKSYRLSEPLIVDRPVILEGMGVGAEPAASVLHFTSKTAGVLVTAPGTMLLHFAVVGTGGSPTSHAIELRARSHLDQLLVHSFAGHGVFINMTAGGDIDGWTLMRNRIIASGADKDHDLLRIEGPTHAGVAIGNDFANTRGWCVNDRSNSSGNTFLANMTDTCDAGPYNSTQGSKDLFLNPYAEGSKRPSIIDAPSIWIGGINRPTGTGFIAQDGAINERWVAAGAPEAGHPRVSAHHGSKDSAGVAAEIGAEGASQGYALRFGGGVWSWRSGSGSGSRGGEEPPSAFGITVDKSPVGAGQAVLPNGFYSGELGADGRPRVRHIYQETSVRGACHKGDDYHVPNPQAGGCGEYRCTVDGRWKCTAHLDR